VIGVPGAGASVGDVGGAPQVPSARCVSEQQNELAGHAPDAGAGAQTAPPAVCRQHWPPTAARQIAAPGDGGAPDGATNGGCSGGMSVRGDGGLHWPLARCASEQQIEPWAHVPDATGRQSVPPANCSQHWLPAAA
jgi:hypothetical protein